MGANISKATLSISFFELGLFVPEREREREKKKKRALSFEKGTRRNALKQLRTFLNLVPIFTLKCTSALSCCFSRAERDCRVRERRRRRRERCAKRKRSSFEKKEREISFSLSLSKESAYTARKNREEEEEEEEERDAREKNSGGAHLVLHFQVDVFALVFFLFFFVVHRFFYFLLLFFVPLFGKNFPKLPHFFSLSHHQQTRARFEERERWRRLPLPHPPPRER